MHLAVLRQSHAVVTELLQFHADPNPRLIPSGYTPLHILYRLSVLAYIYLIFVDLSLMKENKRIPNILLENGADPNIDPAQRLSADAQKVLSELRIRTFFYKMFICVYTCLYVYFAVYLLLGNTVEKGRDNLFFIILLHSRIFLEYPTIMCDSCLISPFSGLRTQ